MRTFITAALAALFAGGPALGNDTILVTASRIPVPAADSGSSVTVISREEIERRQFNSLSDLLRGTPGLAVSRSGGIGAQSQLRLRGAEANQVLFLIDGVEANDPAGNGELALEHLTTWDIERIEIVRGPQSALWGSDALAGVVNIITRRPDGRVQAQGFAERGSFDTWYGGASVGGRGRRTEGMLSVSRLDSAGINSSRSGAERDGYDNSTVTLALRYQATETLDLDVFGRHSQATTEFDTQDFLTGLPADSEHHSDVEFSYARAGVNLADAEGRLAHSLRTTLMKTDSRNFASGVPDLAVEARKHGLYWQSSLRLDRTATSTRAGTLTFAVDHEEEDFRQRGPAGPFGDPNQRQSQRTTAFGAEYLVRPVAPLTLSIGARQDRNSAFRDVTTWRTTAAWRMTATGTVLRASAGTGQKAPTFVERYGFYADQFTGNPDLKPEESRGFEFGIEQRVGSRASVGITWFRERLEDEIDGFFFDPSLGTFTARNLPGPSRRNGAEVDLHLEPRRDLTIDASYTYLDARQPDPATGRLLPEIRRPRHALNLLVQASFGGGRGTASLQVDWQDDRPDQDFSTFPATEVRLDAYVLGSISLAWRLSPVFTVYGRLENLTDESYEDVYGYNTAGRAGYAGLRAGFR